MRAIYIDPVKQTVEAVQVSGKMSEIYKLIGCDLVDFVPCRDTAHVVVIDDDGRNNSPNGDDETDSFAIPALFAAPLTGIAFIFGQDSKGDLCDCSYDAELVQKATYWLTRDLADDILKGQQDAEVKRLREAGHDVQQFDEGFIVT